ncbi:hypothetical protein HN615_15985 [Candidatus Woesearchaeota archaeon]|nr:hypothetical protein [Candidatus Woesearchaeota archaeon]
MKFEGLKPISPEEMAKTEKERTLSDAELLKDGAEYKFDEKGNKILEATDKQIENIRQEKWAEKFVDKDIGINNDIIIGSTEVMMGLRKTTLPVAKKIEKGDVVKLYDDKSYLVLGFTHPERKERDVKKDLVHLREVSDVEAKDIDKKKEKFNELLAVNDLINQYSELDDKHYRSHNVGNEKENLKKELLEIQNKIDKTIKHTFGTVEDLRLNITDKRKLINFTANNYQRYLSDKDHYNWEESKEWTKAIEITSKLLTDGTDFFSMEENNRLTELNKKSIFEKNLTANEKYEEVYLKHKKERIMQIINPKQWFGLEYKPLANKQGKFLLTLNQKEQPKLEYEPFDPQLELRKVRYFSKEELDNIPLEQRRQIQRERLDNYKEQLLKQKKEIAEIQIDLDKEIRNNPDASFEDLIKSLYLKVPEANLTNSQIDIFRDGLNMYAKKHQEVEFYRKKYSNDSELFNACFGHLPKGEVEIIKGPMTLYFRCHNIEDYAVIHSGKFDSDKVLDQHDVTSADMSRGVKIYGSNIPELKGTIIAEKSLGRPINDETYIHEEQHAIYQLFEDERARQDIFMSGMEKSSTKEQEKILVNSLRRKREDFESRAKNEILAYFKDGTDTGQIIETLLQAKETGGLYDYFRQWYITDGEKERDELVNSGLDSNFVDKTFANVFIMEYKVDIIYQSVEAMQALRDKGLAKEKIINLLINEPLSKWPKVVKRVQENSNRNFARPEMVSIEKTIKEYLESSKSPEGNYDLGGAWDKIDELKKEGKLTDEEAGELANKLGL